MFSPGYTNIGCFKEFFRVGDKAIAYLQGSDVDLILDGDPKERQYAIDKCFLAAKSRGYKVFGLSYQGYCSSSDAAQDTYNKYGPSTNCKNHGKGGNAAMQVYRIVGMSTIMLSRTSEVRWFLEPTFAISIYGGSFC